MRDETAQWFDNDKGTLAAPGWRGVEPGDCGAPSGRAAGAGGDAGVPAEEGAVRRASRRRWRGCAGRCGRGAGAGRGARAAGDRQEQGDGGGAARPGGQGAVRRAALVRAAGDGAGARGDPRTGGTGDRRAARAELEARASDGTSGGAGPAGARQHRDTLVEGRSATEAVLETLAKCPSWRSSARCAVRVRRIGRTGAL